MGRQATEILAPRRRGAGHILDYFGPLSAAIKVAAAAESVVSFGPFLPGAVLTSVRLQWTVDVDGTCDIGASRMGGVPLTEADVNAGRALIRPLPGQQIPQIALDVTSGDLFDFEFPVLKRVEVGLEFVGVFFRSNVSASSVLVSLT